MSLVIGSYSTHILYSAQILENSEVHAPVVQRPDNFILWISHYPTVSICANISVFLLVQANMHTPTTVKFGRVLKPCSTFNVKYSLDTE